ncbi:unnamed protein product [Mucor hiemalis]
MKKCISNSTGNLDEDLSKWRKRQSQLSHASVNTPKKRVANENITPQSSVMTSKNYDNYNCDYGDYNDADYDDGNYNADITTIENNNVQMVPSNTPRSLSKSTKYESICTTAPVREIEQRTPVKGTFDEFLRDFTRLTFQNDLSNSDYKRLVYFYDTHLFVLMILSYNRLVQFEYVHHGDAENQRVLMEFKVEEIAIEDITGITPEIIKDFKSYTSSEKIKLHYRDIKELVQHLFSHPLLQKYIILNPSIATREGEAVYNDISNSNWWLDLQQKIGQQTVIIPLMLSSDMTLVSQNARKKTWPLYLTIGNIPKSILQKAAVLVLLQNTHIPPLYEYYIEKIDQQRKSLYSWAKQKRYSCLPVLGTYSADYPEQVLLAGVKSWLSGYGCPRCILKCVWFRHGNAHPDCENRNPDNIKTFSEDGRFGTVTSLKNAFCTDNNKYWDIFDSLLVVDDLHQIGGFIDTY